MTTMEDKEDQPPRKQAPAVAGRVGRPVRPCAYIDRNSLEWLRGKPTRSVQTELRATPGHEEEAALYDQAALDAAVAAERERWASSTHHCTIKCAQCGHKNYFTRAELEREA